MSGRVATLILAAGGSSRLGQPKQLVPFCGRPLVVHAAETALAAALGPVWVVLGAYAEAVGQALAPLPVRIHVHAGWADGLGSSIAAGVAALQAEPPEAILLMLADQPGLTAAHLRALAAAGPDAASAYPDGSLGVPASFGARHFPALALLKGPAGAKPLLAGAMPVPFPAGSFDVDTPADLIRLQDIP